MSFLADRMFKSGWMRLWAVATCSLLVAAVVASAVYVWAAPCAYTFVTVNIADDAAAHDRKLAESVKQEATTKIFTGDIQYSPVLTLEDLAKRGAVTQVAFQWLEPSGWSEKEHNEIDILDRSQIKTAEVIRRVSSYVHRARLRRAVTYVVAVIPVSIVALLLGIGVAWIRQGFTRHDT
jgi:hypothetical protein